MPDPLNMASSGKKNKKSKGKTLSLNSFLQETPGTVQAIPLRKAPSNWADEVEDTYDSYEGRNSGKQQNVVLPTAPKAARGLDDFSDRIPSNPPFNVYLSNLPYDVEEDEIADFFSNLNIQGMRIPREERPGEAPRVKGFGYVEFKDQESLIEALEKPVCMLKGRRIRIEIATNSDSDKRRGGRMDMNRDRADRPEAPTGDWRSGGRKEPDGPERRSYREGGREGGGRDGGGGGGRDFNRERGGEERSAGMWRDGSDRPSFKDRENTDRDRFRDRDREREDKPITRDAPPRYDSNERRGFGPRRDRDDRSERMERGGDRMERGGDRMERGGDRNERIERSDRNGGYQRRDQPEERKEGGGGGGGAGLEGRTRPKLNLAPRTLPPTAEQPAAADVAAVPAAPGEDNKEPEVVKAPAASIFGNAKPVDTTAREREIEERLAKQNEAETRNKDDDKRKDEGRTRNRSPDRRRYSPRRDSPDRQRESPERRRGSQDRQRGGSSSDRGGGGGGKQSPEQRRASPERGPRRDDTKKRNEQRNDRNSSRDNKEQAEKKPAREFAERDMPKLKTPEPINIVGPNKYAFLENDDDD